MTAWKNIFLYFTKKNSIYATCYNPEDQYIGDNNNNIKQ